MSSPSENQDSASQDKMRKAALEDLFKSRLHGFYKQLTTGYQITEIFFSTFYFQLLTSRCGRDSCDCLFCMSNPGLAKHKVSVTEASILAMQLARQPLVYELTCPELIANNDGSTFVTMFRIMSDYYFVVCLSNIKLKFSE